jgi:membrane associated rhomboid family serine protease
MWMVLDAAGIRAGIDHRRGQWLLVVPEEALPRALQELDDYQSEVLTDPHRKERPVSPLAGGAVGVVAYTVVLIGAAGLASRYAFGADWFEAGRAQAGLIVEGEWWRVFTALTLHVDAGHLVANLAFGAVFGFLAAQVLGGGAAWLVILLGGGLGNAVNAFLQPPQHAAVGASTAVFAALGVLVAVSLYHRRNLPGGVVRRWSPLVGGLVLLAYMGMSGERTDVLAHVTGLSAGLVLGAACALLPIAWLERRSVQLGASILTVLLLVLSWMFAV